MRKQFVTKGADPTEIVMHIFKLGRINVELSSMFGDVTCDVQRGKRSLFISGMIHRWVLHKIAVRIFNRLERKYTEAEDHDFYSTYRS